MILRTASIGLSVLMFAGSALAAGSSSGIDQPGSGSGFVIEGSDVDQDAGAQAGRRARRRPRPVRPQVTATPPARPVEFVQAVGSEVVGARPAEAPRSLFAQPLAADESSAAAPRADVGVPAVGPAAATVPPIPAGAVAVVTVLPPLRPSLPAEPASKGPTDATPGDSASALPEVMSSPTGRFVYVLPPERPAFRADEAQPAPALPVPAQAELAPAQAEVPAAQPSLFSKLFGLPIATPSLLPALRGGHNGLDGLITTYARLNGVPEALVHRVVIRESKYNPRAVGRGGALGLMQIKHGTARALGYDGPASGLLDAETNLTYAVKYLAGAYRTAGGDHDRAVQYYARGYYYAAKRSGGETRLAGRHGRRGNRQEAEARADDGTVMAAVQAQ